MKRYTILKANANFKLIQEYDQFIAKTQFYKVNWRDKFALATI